MITNIRVLILEDDLRASYTLESTINQQPGFKVVAVCETCAEARMQFELYKPDLVFVDITLPDGNGVELIREWREHNVQSHFIMTTAVRETKTIEQTVQLGVIDYLVKPIRMSRVIQSLDDYQQYRQTVVSHTTVDQEEIDQLLRKSPRKTLRQTPKGIDSTTLATLKDYLNLERPDCFSSEDIGEKMNFSRITARRYLEYLESEGILRLELDYNTGGRPRRLYKLIF
jgi:two-component system response regulator DcuR